MLELLSSQIINGSKIDTTKLENRETGNYKTEQVVTKDTSNNAEFQKTLDSLKLRLNTEQDNKVETGLEGFQKAPSLKLQEALGEERMEIAQWDIIKKVNPTIVCNPYTGLCRDINAGEAYLGPLDANLACTNYRQDESIGKFVKIGRGTRNGGYIGCYKPGDKRFRANLSYDNACKAIYNPYAYYSRKIYNCVQN
jgi:hypothetical protein